MKLYRKRWIKKKERQVKSQTAEVRIPLLLRIFPTLRRDILVRAAVRRSSTLGSRMGQKQTLAPIIDSGSCDRQIWRIIKMKPPTDQSAKSETKGLVYYCSNMLALDSLSCLCVEGEDCVWCCGKVTLRRRFL